ncbi:MAG: hypothetical protein Q8P62_00205 [Candidatus Peregrinibacteria bacterium]|nr:hypothetical protein [Candidatus Peregrinibacteria bacterium]
MKKKSSKKKGNSVDMKSLKRWKNLSVGARLNWLDSALKLGKLKSF